jgi:hypothetical protein
LRSVRAPAKGNWVTLDAVLLSTSLTSPFEANRALIGRRGKTAEASCGSPCHLKSEGQRRGQAEVFRALSRKMQLVSRGEPAVH